MQHDTIRQNPDQNPDQNTDKDMNKNIDKPQKTLKKKIETRVRCNGGAQASGHPAVYLTLNEEGFVLCPYCSQRFEQSF